MKLFAMVVFPLILSVLLPVSVYGLDYPRGPVSLAFSGKLERRNIAAREVLDAAVLRYLPQHKIETDTTRTEGMTVFEGPYLSDVLSSAGTQGNLLRAVSINDYFVAIPRVDAENYDIISAMRMNNKDLTIRSKAPLWVIYSWSSGDDLRSETCHSRSIWQLMSIDVQ